MSYYQADHDRGAHQEVSFMRCARGFLLTTGNRASGMMGALYAFDRIEDVAAWFVEQYREMEPEEASEGNYILDSRNSFG
jgi:hypothetical protein